MNKHQTTFLNNKKKIGKKIWFSIGLRNIQNIYFSYSYSTLKLSKYVMFDFYVLFLKNYFPQKIENQIVFRYKRTFKKFISPSHLFLILQPPT